MRRAGSTDGAPVRRRTRPSPRSTARPAIDGEPAAEQHRLDPDEARASAPRRSTRSATVAGSNSTRSATAPGRDLATILSPRTCRGQPGHPVNRRSGGPAARARARSAPARGRTCRRRAGGPGRRGDVTPSWSDPIAVDGSSRIASTSASSISEHDHDRRAMVGDDRVEHEGQRVTSRRGPRPGSASGPRGGGATGSPRPRSDRTRGRPWRRM